VQYAIVEYESHRAAAMARRRLIPERVELWGREIIVEWATPHNFMKVSSFVPVKATSIRNSDRYLLFITPGKTVKSWPKFSLKIFDFETSHKIRFDLIKLR
jgi:hypothetical protein